MTLASIILALLLDRLLPQPEELRRPEWLLSWQKAIRVRLPSNGSWDSYWDGVPGVLAVLVPVPLVLSALLSASEPDGLFSGFITLVLSTWVLFWCLGARGFTDAMDHAIDGSERNDETAIQDAMAELNNPLNNPLNNHGEPQTDRGAIANLTYAIFSESNNRFFAPLFWFVVLGPVGALLMRSAELVRYKLGNSEAGYTNFAKAAVQVHEWFAWLPARFLAASYALVGSFETTLELWRRSEFSCQGRFTDNNTALLVCTGFGALGMDPDWERGNESEISIDDARAARGLIHRSAVVWLFIILFLVLLGWIQ